MPTSRLPLSSRLRFWLLRSLLTRSRSPQQGLSLIECLVAIIIVTITVVAITPPIMLATGTRIQSRRADQARQIAQGEIDRIRTLLERPDKDANKLITYTVEDLPTQVAGTIGAVPAATDTPDSANTAASPLLTTSGTCTGVLYPSASTRPFPATNLIKVDIDGDCKPEYVMQIFRAEEQKAASGDPRPFAFKMGVRVYSYTPGETLPTLLFDRRASLVQGMGTRDNVTTGGTNGRRPLAMLYSSVAFNTDSKTYCYLRKQANNNTADTAGPCSTSPSTSPTP